MRRANEYGAPGVLGVFFREPVEERASLSASTWPIRRQRAA